MENTRVFPDKFNILIDGFESPYLYVFLEGDHLMYRQMLYDEHKTVKSTEQQWAKFWAKMDQLQLWQWQPEYENNYVIDGTNWSVEISLGDKAIISIGSNAYPDSKGAGFSNTFIEFHEALNKLVGTS